MEVSEFKNVNDIADTFPNIKIKKLEESKYAKTDILKYREQLKEKGYLLIKDFFPRERVETAASVVDDYLVSNQYLADAKDNRFNQKKEGVLLTGFRPVTHHEKFLSLVESSELKLFFGSLFGEESHTLETKWVRVLGQKEFTDAHSDFYRFKKLGLPLCTCWIPLMDQGIKEGTIALCQDSFKLDFEQETLDQQELPKDFLDMVDESTWLYSDFKMGDILVFDIRTIHASFRNDSNGFRKNTDTRWLPKSLAKKSMNV